MVHILYAVSAFVCSLVLFILPARIRPMLNKKNKQDNAFLLLINWTCAFCLIDGIWGILASELIMNDTLLFIFSSLFHICAAFTPLVWLRFVFTFLENFKGKKIFTGFFIFIFFIEIVLLIINIFNKMMFYINSEGIYCSTQIRRILFYMQYLTYIFIALFSIINYYTKKDNPKQNTEGKISKQNYKFVLLFVLAPIGAGIFQMIYPDAPAYSIGYMLGCCIIFSFVITDMLQRRIMKQTAIEASNTAKTEFLFNMSHDIRTPMNAIIGFTKIAIAHKDEPDKVNDCLKKIETSGEHLLNLINDILEMSRIESGKLFISENPMNICKAIENITQMSQPLAIQKSIIFESENKEISHPYILSDELHIKQVLINLISNAIKYTQAGGKIVFLAEQSSPEANSIVKYKFTIQDNGIGMSEEFQKHLFENFSRETTSTVSKQEGTGLGLSIVKKIVDRLGGTINVKSQSGQGSTFVVEIPFKIVENFEEEQDKKNNEISDTTLKGQKILLVEDNLLNQEIATEILTDAGATVEVATDGDLALKTVSNKGTDYYDCILMDIQMPVMNGYEATEAIRKLQGGDRIPIIGLSANAFESDKKKSFQAGMNDHIVKPIKIETLIETMLRFSKK